MKRKAKDIVTLDKDKYDVAFCKNCQSSISVQVGSSSTLSAFYSSFELELLLECCDDPFILWVLDTDQPEF